jgi:DNA-directed RNA polymerase specialized sigma24 family protein
MDVGHTEILKKVGLAVQNAALNGDPIALLEALSQERVLDGLVRRMQERYRNIDDDDIAEIISFAIDELFYKVRAGKMISNPMGYLWKTADFKAQEHYRQLKKRRTLDEIEEKTKDPNIGRDNLEPEYEDLDSREKKRKEAIKIARSLIPRIKSPNIRDVLGIVIDAAEKGVDDLENQQIADVLGLSLRTVRDCLYRGFNRLSELAIAENIMDEPFEFLKIDADSEEDEE